MKVKQRNKNLLAFSKLVAGPEVNTSLLRL